MKETINHIFCETAVKGSSMSKNNKTQGYRSKTRRKPRFSTGHSDFHTHQDYYVEFGVVNDKVRHNEY